jgi:hypothetical protein
MSDAPAPTGPDRRPDDDGLRREVILPDGVGRPGEFDGAMRAGEDERDEQEEEPVSEIESPGKIIRIGAMVKQLLDEVRNTDLDDASRDHLRDIYDNSISELKSALSPDLAAELDSLSFDFSGDELPSGTSLRLAQAQLVGWLEGLFHGIQATLMAQQMEARQRLEGMRQQLPEHSGPGGPGPGYL